MNRSRVVVKILISGRHAVGTVHSHCRCMYMMMVVVMDTMMVLLIADVGRN